MSPSPDSHRLRARWVFPVDGAPIEDGVLTIEEGRIVGLNSGPDSDATDLGDVAIIPGLVNAHTHLEFSDLASPLTQTGSFPAWIRALVGQRQQRSTDSRDAIDSGLRESVVAGATLLGEIATDDVSITRMSAETPRAVVFRELLGIGDEVIAERLDIARGHLERGSTTSDENVVVGLSPHAPYSLSSELFEQLVQQAVEFHAPVAMHLAETQEELELLRSGTGPLVDMLREFGVWRERFWLPGDSVEGYLEVLSLAKRALVVHGNYLSDGDIDFLARHPQMTVIYCPRTHRYFGHQEHPWRRMLERGVRVALGTDSRASNPDLSLWRELQFLAKEHPEVTTATLLELATLRGADALGLADETGTLASGKLADLAVISFSNDVDADSADAACCALFQSESHVVATMRQGRWLHW